MKKIFLYSAVMLATSISSFAQEKLTLYYNKDGKGLDNPKKAAFYRIVTFDANKRPIGTVEDYWPDGKLQLRSEAVYIDKLDNNKSIWKGPLVEYNKKGVITKQYNFDELGKRNGTQIDFNENGQKQSEIEFTHGNPTNNYYLVYDKRGNPVKYSLLNQQPIKLSTSDKIIVPTSEIKTVYKNGQIIKYYFIDDISVAVSLSRQKLYGDYWEAFITIENGTYLQFDFDPSEITVVYQNGQKASEAEVLTYDYYMKKVNRRQSWSAAFNAFAESAAASQAGYSASATSASASSNYGTVTGQATTQTYNGASQYAANQNASNNIANYNNQQYSIKQNISQGYLKLNTIIPSSRLIGFVNIKYSKADAVLVNVPVNGKIYQFGYSIKN